MILAPGHRNLRARGFGSAALAARLTLAKLYLWQNPLSDKPLLFA
jgi:hypothetical protein